MAWRPWGQYPDSDGYCWYKGEEKDTVFFMLIYFALLIHQGWTQNPYLDNEYLLSWRSKEEIYFTRKRRSEHDIMLILLQSTNWHVLFQVLLS